MPGVLAQDRVESRATASCQPLKVYKQSRAAPVTETEDAMPEMRVCIFHAGADGPLAEKLADALRLHGLRVLVTVITEDLYQPPLRVFPSVVFWTKQAKSVSGDVRSLLDRLPYRFRFVIEFDAIYGNYWAGFHTVAEDDGFWANEAANAICAIAFGPWGSLPRTITEASCLRWTRRSGVRAGTAPRACPGAPATRRCAS